MACFWRLPSGWTGRRFHLRTNKEVFDAERIAIYQDLRVLDRRQESGRQSTALADSAVAIDRVKTNDLGPGQRFAIAATEACDRVPARENGVTIRWLLAHSRVAGNVTPLRLTDQKLQHHERSLDRDASHCVAYMSMQASRLHSGTRVSGAPFSAM